MKLIRESVLDYVKVTLDPGIWDLQSGKLKREVRDQILNTLVKETMKAGVDFDEKWKVYVIGSITGKQYLPTSDIDVTVVVGEKLSDDDLKKLAEHFVRNVNGRKAVETLHPINYYFRRESYFRAVDGAYDVVRDSWVVVPQPTKPFDPEKLFRDQFIIGKRVVGMIMQVYEELLRDLTDLEELKTVRDGFYDKKYWQKSMEVWYDLIVLAQMYRQVHKARKEAFEKEIGDPQRSLENIVYKFLERYGYLDKLHKVLSLKENFIDSLMQLKGV